MAIRRVLLLPGGPVHRTVSEFPQIPSHQLPRIRSFSISPDLAGKIPAKSPRNPRFAQQVYLGHLLQKYGFPQSQLYEFLQRNRFLLNSTPGEVEKSIRILQSFGLPQNYLISTLISCPRVLELVFLRKWQLGFSQLGLSTVATSLIQKFLVESRRSGIEPDDLRRNVSAVKAMGLSDGTVCKVFDEFPACFMSDIVDLERKIGLLKSIGIDNNEIDQICYSFPGFLVFSIEARLKPLFQEFHELGFSRNEVKKALIDCPRLLLGMEVGELSRCMELLNTLKCRVPIKDRVLSEGPLRASINVKLRVDFFCKHGLIHRDAFKVLWVEPRTILYELEDLEKKIVFLLSKMGLNTEWLVEFPEYLGMNLEKQIIPRYNVIEHLRSMGGLGFEVGLKHLVKFSRLKFYNLFVKPYPECEKIFGGAVREVETKPRHPTGLWKMFKPQKFPDSRDDVRNMKSFMEALV